MFKKIAEEIYRILKSHKFLYVVIGLLVIQAGWFALTSVYPMAFDENYHFGIIQIYSHQWLPFLTSQPANSQNFGDLTRYDSYLYHYLMSFPYRLIALFVHQQVAQIIILRFINIALFTTGLVLFARLLRRIRISSALVHVSLLMLVLIPVVPFLAATINYDNLTFLLVPLVVEPALTCVQSLSQRGSIPARSFALLLIVGGLSCLVKYAFAPIFLATLICVLIVYIRTKPKHIIHRSLITSFTSLRPFVKILLVIGLILTSGLLIERYGVNIVRYHSLEPDCSRLRNVADCLQYGPWGRNYNIAQAVLANNPKRDPTLPLFIPEWIAGMMYRLYFAINSSYATTAPLPIPIAVATVIGGVGLILSFVFARVIIAIDRRLLLFTAVILLYVVGLFYVNFTQYLYYRTMLAVNGRYLILILPFVFVWIGLAYQQLVQSVLKARLRSFLPLFSVIVILLTLQGGGAETQLLRAKADWYWPNKVIVDGNQTAQDILSPLVIGSKDKNSLWQVR